MLEGEGSGEKEVRKGRDEEVWVVLFESGGGGMFKAKKIEERRSEGGIV